MAPPIYMPIPLKTPLIVDAIPRREADKLWILTMTVNASDITKPVQANFSVAPFVSATGEILYDQMEQIPVDDVLAACVTNPKMAQALGAIYSAVNELCKERNMFGLVPDPIAPSIAVHPLAIEIDAGEVATFSVMAAGRPLTYQWRKNNVNIDGASLATFTLSSVDEDDEGEYDVVISNAAGSVTSESAELTVIVPDLEQN